MNSVLILVLAAVALFINLAVLVFALDILFNLGKWHKRQIELLGQILDSLRRANLTQERSARAVEKVADAAPEENLDDVLGKRIGEK